VGSEVAVGSSPDNTVESNVGHGRRSTRRRASMKRFVFVLALVAVAGATYVATASPSSQTAGPTNAQFQALKTQVFTLKTKVTALTNTVTTDNAFIATCLAAAGTFPVSQYGDPSGTFGYSFSNDGFTNFYTTGLDVTGSGDPVGAYIQTVAPGCTTGGGGMRRNATLAEHRMVLPAPLHAKH
jgi:hypothetical protein